MPIGQAVNLQRVSSKTYKIDKLVKQNIKK